MEDANITPSEAGADTTRVPSCSFDPNWALKDGSALIRDAAHGSLDAQRSLRATITDTAFGLGIAHPGALPAAVELLMASRMCAAHGEQEDATRLAGTLCFIGDILRHMGEHGPADVLHGESVALLERLAEDGNEVSAIASAEIVKHHPGSISVARALMGLEG